VFSLYERSVLVVNVVELCFKIRKYSQEQIIWIHRMENEKEISEMGCTQMRHEKRVQNFSRRS
jgi:hypothetical protein